MGQKRKLKFIQLQSSQLVCDFVNSDQNSSIQIESITFDSVIRLFVMFYYDNYGSLKATVSGDDLQFLLDRSKKVSK